MDAYLIADELRRDRRLAGLSQRQLAIAADVPQPNIAAYETGRRIPSETTVRKLRSVLQRPSLIRVAAHREAIILAAERRHLDEVRVFGSVARGDARSESDLDLLVHPRPEASIFDLAGFAADVEDELGLTGRVDVVSDRGRGPIMERIRAEAVPL